MVNSTLFGKLVFIVFFLTFNFMPLHFADHDLIYLSANEVRELHEVTLCRSIRYGDGDPVEEWLYKLLCLNATEAVTPVTSYPAPQACTLYYVDK